MDIDVSGWQGPQEPRPAKNANLAKNASLARNASLAKTPDLTKPRPPCCSSPPISWRDPSPTRSAADMISLSPNGAA